MINIIFGHYRLPVAVLVIFIIYKILVKLKVIERAKNSKFIRSALKVIKQNIVEVYLCTVLVMVAYFIYYQVPQITNIYNFTKLVEFLFTPPLKYLIILQVGGSLIFGLFQLPYFTIDKIITPFGHYNVTKKVEEVKQEMNELNNEFDNVINMFRARTSMLSEIAINDFTDPIKQGHVDKQSLIEFITLIEHCYNTYLGQGTVSVCTVTLIEGNLDLSQHYEIPLERIIDSFSKKVIITSDEGMLPAEVAVPLEFADNSAVIVYLRSESAMIGNEDGETIQNMWKIIQARRESLEKKGLQEA